MTLNDAAISPGRPAAGPIPAVGAGPCRGAANIIGGVRNRRAVIQDFRPLGESLEWELGQQYWRSMGNRAFVADSVPYAVNNTGLFSVGAAEILYAGLEAEEDGGTGGEIFVLELGIGVGLFARFFLDHFRRLCERSGKNYYDRVCYVAADRSLRMLEDAARSGIFANHPGRYRLRVVDAVECQRDLADEFSASPSGGPQFRAVFLNYVLDCLPPTILRIQGEKVSRLQVRTCITRGVDLADAVTPPAEELARMADSTDPEDRRILADFTYILSSEYEYFHIKDDDVPYGRFAAEYGRQVGSEVLLNDGAISCLESILKLSHENSIIIINDYGYGGNGKHEGPHEHQRFSGSTAIGLNFPMLKTFFTGDDFRSRGIEWLEPPNDWDRIYSRAIARRPSPATSEEFRRRFSGQEIERIHSKAASARSLASQGCHEAALAAFQEALLLQPYDWMLMSEASKFLTFAIRDPSSGRAMAEASLLLNPSCSSELWDDLGDSLFMAGDAPLAMLAFRKALLINDKDARAHYNLACGLAREGRDHEALRAIAAGLACDLSGHYRKSLLGKQAEILAGIDQTQQRKKLLASNRLSHSPR